ncbi:MAG TPA: phage tail protein [Anaerolineaceae bacterium]
MKQSAIKNLLPAVFQRTVLPGSSLAALLAVMENQHAPSEHILDTLENTFNPYHTPFRFVPYLTGWVDLDRLLAETPDAYALSELPPYPAGTERLRDLIAWAARLSRWRGTARGLKDFLETATGVEGIIITEEPPAADGRPRPFHMSIQIPAAGKPLRALIDRIIRMEKPAYMTYDLYDIP